METADATVLADMYAFFLDQSSELVALIDAHVGRADYRLLRQVAHMFKSSAHTVGASELAAILADLESAASTRNENEIIQHTVGVHRAVESVERAIRAEIQALQ